MAGGPGDDIESWAVHQIVDSGMAGRDSGPMRIDIAGEAPSSVFGPDEGWWCDQARAVAAIGPVCEVGQRAGEQGISAPRKTDQRACEDIGVGGWVAVPVPHAREAVAGRRGVTSERVESNASLADVTGVIVVEFDTCLGHAGPGRVGDVAQPGITDQPVCRRYLLRVMQAMLIPGIACSRSKSGLFIKSAVRVRQSAPSSRSVASRAACQARCIGTIISLWPTPSSRTSSTVRPACCAAA